MKFALAIYLALALTGAAWGTGFVLRSEFTPYHGAAAGVAWTDVPANFQVVILALTKLAGGLWVAVSLGVLVLLCGPFRHGARWARWAVPGLLLAELLAPVPAMVHLTLHSSAQPPWVLTAGCVLATVVAFAVSLGGQGNKA